MKVMKTIGRIAVASCLAVRPVLQCVSGRRVRPLALVAGIVASVVMMMQSASAQYVFTNGVPDPSTVIVTANNSWVNVATLIVSILALSIIVSIVYKIRRRG